MTQPHRQLYAYGCMYDTIASAWDDQGTKQPDALHFIDAFFHGARRTLNFRETLDFIRRGAGWVGGLYSEDDDAARHVGILSENSSRWMLAYYSITYAGAVVVPLDIKQAEDDIALVIRDSGLRFLLVSPTFADFGRRLQQQGLIKQFFELNEDWEQRVLATAPLSASPARPETPASIIYTSGTTGTPKGAVLTHRAVMNQATQNFPVIRMIEGSRILAILPLNHIFIFVGALSALSARAVVVFTDSLKPAKIIEVLKAEKITHLAGIPLLFDAFFKGIVAKAAAKGRLKKLLFLSLLRVGGGLNVLRLGFLTRRLFAMVHRELGPSIVTFLCGGAKSRRETVRAFLSLGYNFQEGYGLTETSGGIIINPFDGPKKVGSVGGPFGNTEVRIDRPGPNGEGEICIRGASLFSGYFKQPELTAQAIDREGWFHTGDLGRLDRRGFLSITGRAKEIIVLSSGKKVAPEEVEFQYAQSPWIEETAALGISEGDVEKIVLVVVPSKAAMKDHPGDELEPFMRREIDRLSAKLASYKRPQGVRLRLEPLPRTSTRKIRRREVEASLGRNEYEPGPRPTTLSLLDLEMMNSPEMAGILSACRRVLENQLDESVLTPSSHLSMDLGMDSIMVLEVISLLEIDFKISVSNDQAAAVQTLGDLYDLVLEARAQRVTPLAPEAERVDWKRVVREAEPLPRKTGFRRWWADRMASADFIFMRLVGKVLYGLKGEGLKNLPEQGPFILAPNHASYLDYPVVMGTLPGKVRKQCHIVGKQELARSRIGRWLCGVHRMIPVDRAGDIVPALVSGARVLKQNEVLLMYPEGTRSVSGKVQPLKRGVALLARELAIPVIPVFIEGTYTVYPPGKKVPRFLKIRQLGRYKITVTYGAPIDPREISQEPEPFQPILDRIESFLRSREQKHA